MGERLLAPPADVRRAKATDATAKRAKTAKCLQTNIDYSKKFFSVGDSTGSRRRYDFLGLFGRFFERQRSSLVLSVSEELSSSPREVGSLPCGWAMWQID